MSDSPPNGMSVGEWQRLTAPSKHRLIGRVCTCGEWSAGCGHDVPEQWRQHVNAAERTSVTPPEVRNS